MKSLSNMLPDKLFGKNTEILKIWLFPIVASFVVFSIFVNLVVPRFSVIKNNLDSINKVKLETKSVNDKRLYLQSLDQEELHQKSLLVENGVLLEKNTYLLTRIIGKIVSEYGYSLSDFAISLGDVKELDVKTMKFDYQKLPVVVEVIGPRSNYLSMVSGIEKSLPVLSIEEFSMTSAGEIANIKLNISAYYLPTWAQTKLENLSVADLTPTKEESDVLSIISKYKYYGSSESQLFMQDKEFKDTTREDPFY